MMVESGAIENSRQAIVAGAGLGKSLHRKATWDSVTNTCRDPAVVADAVRNLRKAVIRAA
jgi:hypothetical protein